MATNPPDPGVEGVLLDYTKPGVLVQAGAPTFRTQKILAGRSIVSDTFSDVSVNSTCSVPLTPGMGMYVHRDGYNVLYGDWSAKWYGDPKLNILWYPNFDSGYGCAAYESSLANNWVTMWRNLDGSVSRVAAADGVADLRCGPQIWHIFDLSNGIDVDAQ
jgi:hypothetical protein